MALVKGVNCGFVLEAPTADPVDGLDSIDAYASALKDESPAGAAKVTEIGWWCDNATEEADFEVGLYSHSTGDDKPVTLLGSATFAKGTAAGWKKATVDISISAGTIYWIAFQLDNTDTTTQTSRAAATGEKYGYKSAPSNLPTPTWDSIAGGAYAAYLISIYAVYESPAAPSSRALVIGRPPGVYVTKQCITRDFVYDS